MAIDASIALQGRGPQLDDPLTVRAKQAQLRDLSLQEQMRQFQLQGSQREQQEQQTLADLYRSAGNDQQALMSGMAERGLGARIPGFQKQQAELTKATTENEAAKLKQAKEKLGITGAALSSLLANPSVTHQDVIGTVTNLVQQGLIDQAQGAQMVRSLPGRPEQLRPFLLSKGMEVMDASKRIELMLPKTDIRNMGGADQQFSTDQLTGQVTPGQSFSKTATPGDVMTDERVKSEGRLNRAVAKDANQATRDVAGAKRSQDTEMKLADDYRVESKGFSETATAMKKVKGALQTAEKNPGSALAAGTAFMKILDPNSVVRESELGMALNASGWFDRAANIVPTLMSGKKMTAEQVKNLGAAADALFEEAKAAQREVDAAFEGRARQYGANPANVIIDRGQKATAPKAPTPGPVLRFDSMGRPVP